MQGSYNYHFVSLFFLRNLSLLLGPSVHVRLDLVTTARQLQSIPLHVLALLRRACQCGTAVPSLTTDAAVPIPSLFAFGALAPSSSSWSAACHCASPGRLSIVLCALLASF